MRESEQEPVPKKKKTYTLKVWNLISRPEKYTISKTPHLRTMTTCDAIEFELEDGRLLMISAHCIWTVEENK